MTRSRQCLEIDEQDLGERFNRTPFVLRHSLANHPLFELPRILDLSEALPAQQIEYNGGDAQIDQDPHAIPSCHLSPKEIIEELESARAWMVIKNVEHDPEYGALLASLIEPFAEHVEGIHDL